MAGYGLACGLPRGMRIAALTERLQSIADGGFTHCELSGKSLGVVINGEIVPARLDALRSALDGVELQYTLHGVEVSSARGGNLVDLTDPLQRLTVESDIRLAAAIGATVVVYHSGMLRDADGTFDALERGMEGERVALRELGDLAGEHGITLAVENRDPVSRYIDRLVYGMDLERLAAQVEEIDHPHVGICFDTGHAWLAATYLGFDYMAGVRRIAPLTTHIHLSDNFGKPLLNQQADPSENLIQGLGDLHLIPRWGTVPFDAVAEVEFRRQPIAIVEMRETFADHLTDAAAAARRFAERMTVPA